MNAHSSAVPAMQKPVEITLRREPAVGASWNAEAMTFDAVLATRATGVKRYDYDRGGWYSEFLALDESQEWPEQVPLLDNHRRSSLTDQIGSVDQIRSVNGELHGRATLSRNHDLAQRIAADLSDGHRVNLSIGYITLEQRERSATATQARQVTATKIELVEASLVIIPADRSTGIRSQDVNTNPAPLAIEPAAPPLASPPAVNVLSRAETNAEIRIIARSAGLDQSWVDGQIDAEADLNQVRTAALAAMAQRAAPTSTIRSTASVGVDHNDPELRVRHVGEAIYARYAPGHNLSEPARQYAGQTLLDIARESLRLRGLSSTGLSVAAVFERALHTTSDFPLILGDSVGRTLREAYRAAPSGLKLLGRKTTARDFKAKHRLQLSEAPRLLPVGENGEFKSGTLAEGQESYKLTTFGRIVGITRQALINDDLGAFADLARRIGQAAAATEAQLLVDLLLANAGAGPTMADGKPLFHADHKNKAAAGAALAVAKLADARTAMRKQVGLSGELIDVTPRHVLVPPDLETSAEQILTALNPTKAEDTNPFAGKLGIVVEPRLSSATRWYVAADPATVDGLEYAYLEGEEGVQIETKAGFEVDGVQVKARLDFGAGFVDHRGWYVNEGG